ncbi:hypothetical protein [Jannaschia sp. R86511]|uniref:hypothetical protein n=1 Tax=Jannaschia sp. R86511 TaxID=3093853 RepID=UPI0036D34BFE
MRDESRSLVLHKQWQLRPGVSPDDVVALVQQQVLPAYQRLSDDVTLGLELSLDGTSVVAVQRWLSPEAQEAVVSSDSYSAWWADYQPALAEWDRLLAFVSEWNTVDVDLRGRDAT